MSGQLIRFCIIGSLSALTFFLMIILMVEAFNFDNTISSITAYILTATTNYLLHYYWSFKSDEAHIRAASKYIYAYGIGFLINLTAFSLLTTHTDLHYFICQIISALCIALFTFFASIYWVFKPSQSRSNQ